MLSMQEWVILLHLQNQLNHYVPQQALTWTLISSQVSVVFKLRPGMSSSH